LGLGDGLGLGDALGDGLGLGDVLGLGAELTVAHLGFFGALQGLGGFGELAERPATRTSTLCGDVGTLANPAVASRRTKTAIPIARMREKDPVPRPTPAGGGGKGLGVSALPAPTASRSLDRSRSRRGSSLPRSRRFVLIWPVRIRSQMASSLLPMRKAASDAKIHVGTRTDEASSGSRRNCSPSLRTSCKKFSSASSRSLIIIEGSDPAF
jgi:hypothetical protein